jgi:hypothetical protein
MGKIIAAVLLTQIVTHSWWTFLMFPNMVETGVAHPFLVFAIISTVVLFISIIATAIFTWDI